MKKFTVISVNFSTNILSREYKFEDQKYFLGQNNNLVELELKKAKVFTEVDMSQMDLILKDEDNTLLLKDELKTKFKKLNPQYKNLTSFDFNVTINPTTYKIG